MLRIFRHLSLNSVKKSHKSVESVCNLALIRLSLPRPLSTSTPSDHSSDPYEERPQFPGSRSEWTQELKFIDPTNYEGIPRLPSGRQEWKHLRPRPEVIARKVRQRVPSKAISGSV